MEEWFKEEARVQGRIICALLCAQACTSVLGSVSFRQLEANDSNIGFKIVSSSADLEAARPCYSISSTLRSTTVLHCQCMRDHHQ